MDEKIWNETVRNGCDKAIDVRGGCNCRRPDGTTDYCSYSKCPKIDHRTLYTCGGCSKKCTLVATVPDEERFKKHLVCIDSRNIDEDIRQKIIDDDKSIWV